MISPPNLWLKNSNLHFGFFVHFWYQPGPAWQPIRPAGGKNAVAVRQMCVGGEHSQVEWGGSKDTLRLGHMRGRCKMPAFQKVEGDRQFCPCFFFPFSVVGMPVGLPFRGTHLGPEQLPHKHPKNHHAVVRGPKGAQTRIHLLRVPAWPQATTQPSASTVRPSGALPPSQAGSWATSSVMGMMKSCATPGGGQPGPKHRVQNRAGQESAPKGEYVLKRTPKYALDIYQYLNTNI